MGGAYVLSKTDGIQIFRAFVLPQPETPLNASVIVRISGQGVKTPLQKSILKISSLGGQMSDFNTIVGRGWIEVIVGSMFRWEDGRIDSSFCVPSSIGSTKVQVILSLSLMIDIPTTDVTSHNQNSLPSIPYQNHRSTVGTS